MPVDRHVEWQSIRNVTWHDTFTINKWTNVAWILTKIHLSVTDGRYEYHLCPPTSNVGEQT